MLNMHTRRIVALALLSSLQLLLVGGQVFADESKPACKMTSEQLTEKALRIQAIVEDKTVQAHGLIPMFVRPDDYKLPTEEDFRGAYRHRHLLGKTEAEVGIPPMHIWRAWEDSATDTAFYLGAMAYKYRCTQDPKDMAICRRTLGAIQYIHDVAAEKGEPGFLCKPYGGVYSNQTSGDQVQCVTTGLAAYLSIAPPDDHERIRKLLRSFADHQIAMDYQCLHGYFGYPRDAWTWKDWDWTYGVIYTPLMYLAWDSTGDPKYLHEVHRWYDHCGLDKKGSPPSDQDEEIRGPGDGHKLNLAALLMQFDPDHYELWRSFMLESFRKSAPGILPDGTVYFYWEYNAKTKTLRRLPSDAFGGPVRSGRIAAQLAMGLVMVQRWFPDEDMSGPARKVLEGVDEDTFRFIMPVSPDQELPAERRIESRLLDHDALTAWLWAFWEGRWRGYW
jgi:hypothetical protein